MQPIRGLLALIRYVHLRFTYLLNYCNRNLLKIV